MSFPAEKICTLWYTDGSSEERYLYHKSKIWWRWFHRLSAKLQSLAARDRRCRIRRAPTSALRSDVFYGVTVGALDKASDQLLRVRAVCSTVSFLRSRPFWGKNAAKLRNTFVFWPNESPSERHTLQNCATLVRAFRSQMLYPVELRAPEKSS
jgi:hypothetical protein